MTIQVINTGTSPNSGNGDSIRTAFNKVNNNFDFLSGVVLGTSTNFTSGIQDVVRPMLVHDAHRGVVAQYNPVTDRVVLSVNTETLHLDTVSVANTTTLRDVVITGTVSIGFLQGFDDVSIIKYAEDGPLNFRIRNTYGLGTAEVNLLDAIDGSFNIVHQNSGVNSGYYHAGQNYIFDDLGNAINIGRSGNINFYADENWSGYSTPSLTVSNSGTVNVQSTLTIAQSRYVVNGNTVQVTDVGMIINNLPIESGKLVSGTYTVALSTAGSLILPGDIAINGTADQYRNLEFRLNESSLILNEGGMLTLNQYGTYDGQIVPGTLFRIDTDQPNYTQSTIQNKSNDLTATSDLIFVRNNGNVSLGEGVLDIGINSSNYSEPQPYGVHTPGSAYMFSNDADLIIGTQSPGKRLVFHAGGSTSDDSAGSLDGYAWRFNRSVQTIVSTPGPLNFTVWNTRDNSAAQAVYQAMNDVGDYLQVGINSSNPGAYLGSIGPGQGFIHMHGSTATIHVGNGGDLAFWSDEINNGYENGLTATLYMSRLDRSSTFGGHVVPYTNLTYDLGSPTNQWRSLYVGTSTIYIGGKPLTIDESGSLIVNGLGVVGSNQLVNSPYDVTLDVNGNTVFPSQGHIIQNNSYTRTTNGANIDSGTSTVIWTGLSTNITSVKMTIQVEGNENGDNSGWHTQVCEAIIADRWFQNIGTLDPQMTVYGVVHTSVAPLATFTVQRNATTHLIEVIATPTASATGTLYPKVYSVELGTRD